MRVPLDALLGGVERQALGATSERIGRVAAQCLQLFGGYGCMAQYLVSRFWTDARVLRIDGGTSEIMKELVARGLLGR